MTFNTGGHLSSGRVRTSRGRRGAAIGGGIGGGAGILVLVVYLFTGADLSGFVDSGGQQPVVESSGVDLEHCRTGEDANRFVECRMVGAAQSLDAYWQQALPQQGGVAYVMPDFTIFEGSVDTGCGAASSAVGPFYCPPDDGVYLDTGFFDQLETQLGAQNAPLAQLYIVGHEWGHHIQHQLGATDGLDPGRGADSAGVRLELQADCYAGMWLSHAATVPDPVSGAPLLQQPTRQEVDTALLAAAAVGDDRIQRGAGQRVNPEAWTHGSAEQRTQWFATGYNEGTLDACDTFAR